jgi:hypothetical protein
MKPIQLHPFSLLGGGALTLLAFVAMVQQVGPRVQMPANPRSLESVE